jgi:hypothetical protein
MANLNALFLNNLNKTLQDVFASNLSSGKNSARSTEKLKIIHSFISDSLKKCLNDKSLSLYSIRPGVSGGEKDFTGRYMEKAVDIAVCKGDKQIAAIGFKFVLSNYQQNSNNYFENMLGETANLRCNKIPYFQVLVLLQELPYYQNGGMISKMEKVSQHNIDKYIKLSQDNPRSYFHTPDKTLLYLVALPSAPAIMKGKNKKDYARLFNGKSLKTFDDYNKLFDDGIIVNDFDEFVTKVAHTILGL